MSLSITPLELLASQGYSNVTVIGSGAFGSVYKCTSSISGHQLAVKVCKDERARDSAEREARIMFAITPHPNVLPLISFASHPSGTIMVLPLATGGDTLRLMHERGCAPLAESESRHLFSQLVDAVEHVHTCGFVHRDIKCENILLSGMRRRTVLLADFGFSTRYLRNEKSLTEAWGSLHYSSPEIVSLSKAVHAYEGPEVDVWSMGVVLYAWTTGRLPFGGTTEDEIGARIIAGDYPVPRQVSAELTSLIATMLHVDPAKRSTIVEIRKHPWMVPAQLGKFVPASTSLSAISSLGCTEPAPAPRRNSAAAIEPRKPSLLRSVVNRVFKNEK